MRRAAIVLGFAFTVALAAADGQAADPNLLVNSTFDANVNGWFGADGGVVLAYTTTNADGGHPAGSALVSKIGGPSDYAFQCVSVTGGSVYVLSGDVFLRSGSNTDEQAQIGLKFYSGASCANTLTAVQTEPVTTHVTWTHRQAVVNAPSNAVTAAFQLIVSATTIQEAQFDGVRLTPLRRGDANGDGAVDVSDVFYLINYLFAGGPAPSYP